MVKFSYFTFNLLTFKIWENVLSLIYLYKSKTTDSAVYENLTLKLQLLQIKCLLFPVAGSIFQASELNKRTIFFLTVMAYYQGSQKRGPPSIFMRSVQFSKSIKIYKTYFRQCLIA